MKQLILDSSSTFLRVKNYLKIFPSKKIHEKGGPALKCAVSEPLTLYLLQLNDDKKFLLSITRYKMEISI